MGVSARGGDFYGAAKFARVFISGTVVKDVKILSYVKDFSLLRTRCLVFNSMMSLTHPLTTTTFELPGFRVTKSFGVVRGIIVRSRSVIGNVGASIQSLFGGNISLYTSLCERAREDAYNLMLTHAGALGANAVIGVRYDATEIAQGITEVLCYGTAVYVEAA
jgi:uncharacterized protein YbjQ (UPF0145 family)